MASKGKHPNSLANLKLGRISQGKENHSITISPENWEWLKSRGKPSKMIDLIVEMNRKGELVGRFLLERAERQLKRAETQNKELRERVRELEKLRQQRSN